MANYRLVSNATFRPFSFEEYVKPYQMYGEAYKEIETNIVDLETQAGKWDKLANEQSDPKTHATYKAYADELILSFRKKLMELANAVKGLLQQ